MKKNIILLLIFLLSVTYGCNNAEEKKVESTPTVETAPDTTSVPVVEKPYDADPSDTIPGDRYNPNTTSKQTEDLVRLTLKDQLKDDISKDLIDSFSRRFIFFEYDLNDDGTKEIFVGLNGPYFCGSGGCTQYLLDNQGNVITKFTVSGYPIVIDKNKTNGYKDLFIHSGGKDRIVKYNGKKYPSNPSTLPALKVVPGDGLPRALNYVNEPYPWFRI